jgi:hypothetical protein
VHGVIAAARKGAGAKPLTERIARLISASAEEIQAAQQVTTAVTSLPMACDTCRWTPNRVREADLAALAAEWGVERFVDQLRRALDSADDTASQEGDR